MKRKKNKQTYFWVDILYREVRRGNLKIKVFGLKVKVCLSQNLVHANPLVQVPHVYYTHIYWHSIIWPLHEVGQIMFEQLEIQTRFE